MSEMISSMFNVVWVMIVVLVIFRSVRFSKNRPGKTTTVPNQPRRKEPGEEPQQRSARKQPTISDDGYRIPKDQDITCTGRDGHSHPEADGPRYIVHEKPEEGYVILNGVKRRLSDCKNL